MIKSSEILVVHDDADLPFGRVKLKFGGGGGGHRGISSIIYYLKSEEFLRLKIGIGKEKPLREYVLSEFKEEEKKYLFDELFPFLKRGIEILCKEGIKNAMNFINSFKKEVK
jgi:PTH1 family peptidyl-tRNA hydrolase